MVGDITDVLPKGGIRGVLDILEMILGVRRELANKERLHCGVCFHKVYTRGIYLLLSLGSRPGPEVMERAGRSSTAANTSGRLSPAISALPSVHPRMLCKLGHAGARLVFTINSLRAEGRY